MADEHEHETGDSEHAGGAHNHSSDPDIRQTSPMRPFTTRQVGVGFVVLVVGVIVTFGLPLLFS